MKLIDLLVRELPKRGGWPDWAQEAVFYNHIEKIKFWDANGGSSEYGGLREIHCIIPGATRECVTREEYESALAASKQPVWDGEGLPPVGAECEITAHNSRWGLLGGSSYLGSVIAYSGEDFWFKHNDGASTVTRTDKVDFRPIRTEAERKRDEFTAACVGLDNSQDWSHSMAYFDALYAAIAAGKIPGVKLDDI